MVIESDEAPAMAEWEGKTYYFCSAACKELFEEEPADYVGGAPVEAGADGDSGTGDPPS